MSPGRQIGTSPARSEGDVLGTSWGPIFAGWEEENQIFVNNIKKNKDNLYKEEETSHNYVIQPSDRRVNLIDTINLILKFNDTI